jgi:4a-hydroxytetrahydrobiopterin dehydratase
VSEAGWKAFLEAEGVDDWAVLHGGPTAAFRVPSLADAARLAVAIAEIRGLRPRTAVTITAGLLTVRLTREMWGTEESDIELARAVSAVAGEQGATPDRAAVQEIQVAISAKPDEIDVGFWRAVLGYAAMAPDNAIDPLAHGSTVWMQDLDPAKPLGHAMHIDVSLAREQAQARVEAALAAGGRIVEESDAPGAWILADPAGNKVCIAAWPDGAPTRESADEATTTD